VTFPPSFFVGRSERNGPAHIDRGNFITYKAMRFIHDIDVSIVTGWCNYLVIVQVLVLISLVISIYVSCSLCYRHY